MRKYLKQDYYKMEMGEDGKRHRVWYHIPQEVWDMMISFQNALFYGDPKNQADFIMPINTWRASA